MTTPLIEAIAREMEIATGSHCPTCEQQYSFDSQYLAQAALTAITEAGMVIVPREPTPEIVEAVWENIPLSICIDMQDVDAATNFYRAMIAAPGPLDSQPIQCEPMHAIDEDGWCEWIHPLPGYLMQCCDCGLVHEMQYAIVPSHENCGDAELNEGETKDGVIIFRARRHAPLDTKEGE